MLLKLQEQLFCVLNFCAQLKWRRNNLCKQYTMFSGK